METLIPYVSNIIRDATTGELRGAFITIILILLYKYVYSPWSRSFDVIEDDLKIIKRETKKLMKYGSSSTEILHDLEVMHQKIDQVLHNSNIVHNSTLKNEKNYEYIANELSDIKKKLSDLSMNTTESRISETQYRARMENQVEKVIDRLDPVLTALRGIK